MKREEIKELLDDLIRVMNDNDLIEIEIEQDGWKVRLKKGGELVEKQVVIPAPVLEAAASNAPAPVTEHPVIKSPMVGTFYRSPAPDADAFVAVGDSISEESVVCIIEAMKVMNEIKAEISGRVTEIFVENGEPVEFGQPLFVVEPE